MPDADRLVVLAARLPDDQTGLRYTFSWLALQDYRRQAALFTDILGSRVYLGGFSAGDKGTQAFMAP